MSSPLSLKSCLLFSRKELIQIYIQRDKLQTQAVLLLRCYYKVNWIKHLFKSLINVWKEFMEIKDVIANKKNE